MKERQSLTSLRQYGLYLWQVEHSRDHLIKFSLAHSFDYRGDALHRRPTRYEPVIALLALAVLDVLCPALNSLHLMRELADLLLSRSCIVLELGFVNIDTSLNFAV